MALEELNELNRQLLNTVVKRCIERKESELHLTNLGLNDQDMPVLVQLLNQTDSITSVNISVNNIRNGVGALAECKYIQKLYSEQNDLGDEGVIALAHSNIRSIVLNGCRITDKAAQALLDRQCPNSIVGLILCKKVSPALLEAIIQKNKANQKHVEAAPKKDICPRIPSFWPGSKKNEGAASAKQKGTALQQKKL